MLIKNMGITALLASGCGVFNTAPERIERANRLRDPGEAMRKAIAHRHRSQYVGENIRRHHRNEPCEGSLKDQWLQRKALGGEAEHVEPERLSKRALRRARAKTKR